MWILGLKGLTLHLTFFSLHHVRFRPHYSFGGMTGGRVCNPEIIDYNSKVQLNPPPPPPEKKKTHTHTHSKLPPLGYLKVTA